MPEYALATLNRWLIHAYEGASLCKEGDIESETAVILNSTKVSISIDTSENRNDENQKWESTQWKSTTSFRLQTC